jgi:hypothetical protein
MLRYKSELTLECTVKKAPLSLFIFAFLVLSHACGHAQMITGVWPWQNK